MKNSKKITRVKLMKLILIYRIVLVTLIHLKILTK